MSDLSKFAQAQFDNSNEILKLTRKSSFVIGNTSEVGLGWFINTKGVKGIQHSGGTSGYTSYMVIDTENKNGVIVLSNISAVNPLYINVEDLCYSLMKTLKKG